MCRSCSNHLIFQSIVLVEYVRYASEIVTANTLPTLNLCSSWCNLYLTSCKCFTPKSHSTTVTPADRNSASPCISALCPEEKSVFCEEAPSSNYCLCWKCNTLMQVQRVPLFRVACCERTYFTLIANCRLRQVEMSKFCASLEVFSYNVCCINSLITLGFNSAFLNPFKEIWV